jgi:hypothetical protein
MHAQFFSVTNAIIFIGLVMLFRVVSARSFGSWSWPLSILLAFLLLVAPGVWTMDFGS